jgi:hypothetical protein
MSNNIFNTNDDDIFDDYQETSTSNDPLIDTPVSNEDKSFEKVFSDLNSPFESLIQNSSLKVNFGEAFYNAAHEWIMQGYREANNITVIDSLVQLTDGKYLYQHRLNCSRQTLARKKTVLKFLSILLDNSDETPSIVAKNSKQDLNLDFSEAYFSMFFRSFYNIQLHTFHHEIALYKALCEILEVEPDQTLCDPTLESIAITETTDYINSLYMQYFDRDLLQQKIDKYLEEISFNKNQA